MQSIKNKIIDLISLYTLSIEGFKDYLKSVFNDLTSRTNTEDNKKQTNFLNFLIFHRYTKYPIFIFLYFSPFICGSMLNSINALFRKYFISVNDNIKMTDIISKEAILK